MTVAQADSLKNKSGVESLHIGMVSQWYDPEVGAAAQPGVIARSLRDLGHEVEVVTGWPNYPSGQLYPGYKPRLYQSEWIDGVRVHRAPLYPSHDENPLRRSANYISFSLAASIAANTRLGKVDACLVHASPATAALPAMVRKALRGTPIVVHIHDLWPDSVLASGLLRRRRLAAAVDWSLSKFCLSMYKAAHAVAITAPGMRAKLVSRGVPDEKIHFVPNWADETLFHPRQASDGLSNDLGVEDRTVVMYAGNLGEYQNVEQLVRSAIQLKHRRDLLFLIVGDGVMRPALERLTATSGLTNLKFLGSRPLAEMPALISLSDLQIVSLQPLQIFETTLPSKLMSIMASARPIVAALSGDAAEVVKSSGAGYVVPPDDSLAMATAIETFANLDANSRRQLGSLSYAYYKTHLARSTVSAHLETLLLSAAISS